MYWQPLQVEIDRPQRDPAKEVWCAVLYQAIHDAVFQGGFGESPGRELLASEEARYFLLEDEAWFPMVCHMAGIRGDWLRERLRMIERPGFRRLLAHNMKAQRNLFHGREDDKRNSDKNSLAPADGHSSTD